VAQAAADDQVLPAPDSGAIVERDDTLDRAVHVLPSFADAGLGDSR
jgi:hypothetical protein